MRPATNHQRKESFILQTYLHIDIGICQNVKPAGPSISIHSSLKGTCIKHLEGSLKAVRVTLKFKGKPSWLPLVSLLQPMKLRVPRATNPPGSAPSVVVSAQFAHQALQRSRSVTLHAHARDDDILPGAEAVLPTSQAALTLRLTLAYTLAPSFTSVTHTHSSPSPT